MRVQDIRSVAGEGQAVRAARKPEAEEVASVLEAESENTRGSSSAGSEAEVVGGDGIVRGEVCARKEVVVGVVVVEQGNLIGRGDIQHASDKTMEEVHGGQAPSEEFPEGGVREMTDCMKVGREGRVEVGAEGGRLDVRLGMHSRSGLEETKEGHGEGNMRIYDKKPYQEGNLRAGNVWKVCLSMSSLSEGVYGNDEPRHGNQVRRLNGVMVVVEAFAVVAEEDARCRGHMDKMHALTAVGDAVVGSVTNIGDAGVAENEAFDERRKELRPKPSWSGSNHVWGVDSWEKDTQRKQAYSLRVREVPEQ